MTEKTPIVRQIDAVQAQIFDLLRPIGFRRKGRAFNRQTEEGVVQTISIQTGQYKIGPPLPDPIAHFRPNLYGKFTVNLGVFVKEVYNRSNVGPPKGVITDASCAIRTRLSQLSEGRDHWWNFDENLADLIDEIGSALLNVAIPWLNRFGTREAIVRGWVDYNENENRLSNVARLDVAMILLAGGDLAGARQLFAEHVNLPSHNVNHAKYVRDLALKFGLGTLA